MFLFLVLISLIIITLVLLYIYKTKEKWSSNFSGWPGPLEGNFRTNIPALYGNPKYEAPCRYKKENNNSSYYTMRELP